MNKSHLLIGAAAFAVAISASQPAFAQSAADCVDANENGVCDSDETTDRVIVVTGSRISRPTLESSVPVTTVTTDDILSQGDVSLGDALNDLPSLRSTFSQSNSTRFIGTAGLNILDLRGLGTSRTLTLVNGRRHITVSPGDYVVDVNTIPSELIDRIDIVTGGNSAIYGSDAVAGVVNFIMKRDFEGLRLTGQGGVSSRGDRGSYFGAVTWGKNFADGRGNIAIAGEYSKSEALKFTQRDYLSGAFSGRKQFNLTENTADDGPFGSDNIVDNAFFTNVRNNNISDGGMLSASCTAAVAADRTRCTADGFPVRYIFDPAGNLIVNPIERDLRPVGSNNSLGGLGSTLSNYGDLIPDIERISLNLLGHFDISDGFRPFIEAKYVRLNVYSESSPSFVQGISGDPLGFFSCSNPFLTTQNITSLQAIGRCLTPTGTIAINRNNLDLGVRAEDNVRETYRIVAGVQGTFNDDWNYEVALNYGKLDGRTKSINNLQLFNADGSDGPYLKAMDAVRNSSNQIVCRVNADASTTNDDPNCVPLNIFGEGRADPRAIDYVMTDSFYGQKASQFVASASVAGDLSQLFELPGGPIGFAIGAEYREERGRILVDELTSSDATFLTALQPVKYPKLTVKEIYGEVRIPLLADMPFAQTLELSAAGRISDYNTSAGTTYAYNGSMVYAPFDFLKFRGAYNRSVRVPTQSDLFDPQGQNFATIVDPCAAANINNSPTRLQNCRDAGIPVGFGGLPPGSNTSIAQGGNPFLTAEKSDSYTVGGIFTPNFLPGFSLTVDYYDITVKNLIATLTAQTIVNLCYDNPNGINNQYCAIVFRKADGNFDDPAVIAGPVNFAKLTTSGIDVDAAYNHKFDNGDRLSFRFIGSWLRNRTQFTDPVNPITPNRVKSELGDPEWEFGFNVAYEKGPFAVRYGLRYIGKQTIGTYEAQNPYTGLCPSTGVTGSSGRTCTPGSLATLDPQNADQFPQIWYPSVVYQDIRLTMKTENKFSFYVGMDNIFDKKPPFNLLGTGAGSSIYDATGRYFYAGIRAEF